MSFRDIVIEKIAEDMIYWEIPDGFDYSGQNAALIRLINHLNIEKEVEAKIKELNNADTNNK